MATNILACGDLHLRTTRPKMRTDDFIAAQERKLQTLIDMANDYECRAVVFPGDVFDRHDASHGLVEWAIRMFKQFPGKVLFVYGQHDLRYHTSDKQNTPLGVLVAGLGSKAVILTEDAYTIESVNSTEDSILFYGCSWGDPLPNLLDCGLWEIVVMHRPVTVKPLPWEHEDLITAKELMEQCPASLFITGDNHTQFIEKSKTSVVFNMGSVMRTTAAQTEFKPAAALITLDGIDLSYKLMPLTIRRGVFDTAQIEQQRHAEDRRNDRLEKLTESLSKSFDAGLSFVDNLRMASKDMDAGVRDILAEVIDV